MTVTREQIAIIETLVRQQWYDSTDPIQEQFGSWISVDQDQALALIEMITGRLPCKPPQLFPVLTEPS